MEFSRTALSNVVTTNHTELFKLIYTESKKPMSKGHVVDDS